MECRVTRDCVGREGPGTRARYRHEGDVLNWEGTLEKLPRWYEPTSGPAPVRDTSRPDVPQGRQGIVPPKKVWEEAKPAAPVPQPSDVQPLSSLNPTADVEQALLKLNRDNDLHWTRPTQNQKVGLPRVDAVSKLAGREVSRGEIHSANPGFNRDDARAAQ